MKQSKWITLTIAAASVLALSACSKKGPGTANNMAAPNAQSMAASAGNASNGAQTYGVKPVTSFQTTASGSRINPMQAPANQSYYFTFDSSKMRPQDVAAMKLQANFLIAHPNAQIKLAGNTDNRGSREYNIALGWRRDQTVARYMEQMGVKPSQIQMVSYGKERPIAYGNNEKAWTLNRRVDLNYKVY